MYCNKMVRGCVRGGMHSACSAHAFGVGWFHLAAAAFLPCSRFCSGDAFCHRATAAARAFSTRSGRADTNGWWNFQSWMRRQRGFPSRNPTFARIGISRFRTRWSGVRAPPGAAAHSFSSQGCPLYSPCPRWLGSGLPFELGDGT